jgi:CBS domain-containing membrane protein
MSAKLDRPVSGVMTEEFASISSADRLDFVDDVMKLGRIRHLPVVDGGKLVGIVSQRDLLAASLSRALDFDQGQRRSFLRAVEVAEVMTPEPVTIAPETTLREAARLVLRHKIGCLPVVDGEGRPIGIVTETDLLRGAYGEEEPRRAAGVRGKPA